MFRLFLARRIRSFSSSTKTSDKHGHKRPYTEKYDEIHGPVLRSYISVMFTGVYQSSNTVHTSNSYEGQFCTGSLSSRRAHFFHLFFFYSITKLCIMIFFRKCSYASFICSISTVTIQI